MSRRAMWIGAGTLSFLVIVGTVVYLQRPATVVVEAPQTDVPRPPEAVSCSERARHDPHDGEVDARRRVRFVGTY